MADIEISVPDTQVEKNRLFTKIIYKNGTNTHELNRAVIKNGSSSFTWNREASFKLVANIPGTTNPWGSDIYGFYGDKVSYSTTPGLTVGGRSATLNVPQITSDNEDYGYYEWNYNWDGSSITSGSTITSPVTPITLKLNGSEDLRYYTVSVSVADNLYLGDSSSTTSLSVSGISAYGSLVTTNPTSSENAAVACVDNNQIKILAPVNRLPDSTPNAFGFSAWNVGEINKELGEFKQSSSYVSISAKSEIVWTAKITSGAYYITNYTGDASTTSSGTAKLSTSSSDTKTMFTKNQTFTVTASLPSGVTLNSSSAKYLYVTTSLPVLAGGSATYYSTSTGTGSNGNMQIVSWTSSTITFKFTPTPSVSTATYFVLNKLYQAP